MGTAEQRNESTGEAGAVSMSPSTSLLACPFCGNPAEHESTATQETIRCTLCPAAMHYDGSGEAVKAMWNARANV